ncbi:MAG: hypothetical protein JW819_11635 [Candidatus Krumholzibacteriota bacterium]|nr:hypothetical protein [Candidatus Krumholzibacteriota bacterium]
MSRQKRLFCGLALFVLLISITSPLVVAKEPLESKDDYNISLATGIGDDDDDHLGIGDCNPHFLIDLILSLLRSFA